MNDSSERGIPFFPTLDLKTFFLSFSSGQMILRPLSSDSSKVNESLSYGLV